MTTTEDKVVRVALYCRRSGASQEESLKSQEEALRNAAEVNGWEIYKVYRDTISGRSEDRKGLNRLLADAKAHKFDVVAVVRADRLSRSLVFLLQLVQKDLSEHGVSFHSLAEPAFSTSGAHGILCLQVMGACAEFEAKQIAARCAEGRKRALARNVVFGSPIKLDAEKLTLARRMRADGASYRQLALYFKVSKATMIRRLKVKAS